MTSRMPSGVSLADQAAGADSWGRRVPGLADASVAQRRRMLRLGSGLVCGRRFVILSCRLPVLITALVPGALPGTCRLGENTGLDL
jgi:hypothetical protein